MTRVQILRTAVSVTDYDEVWSFLHHAQTKGNPIYVSVANVHVVMEAEKDPSYRDVVNGSDIVTTDGVPLVWAARLLGHKYASRVYGPRLMEILCQRSIEAGWKIGLFGSTQRVLDLLKSGLQRSYPGIAIEYAYSPPFTPFAVDQEKLIVESINNSDIDLLFVGLGCPKQERWMAAHANSLRCSMVGVGAAFDFLAGTKPRAPRWMQAIGLEWLFRLFTEPRRLWKRYLTTNPKFVALFLMQYLRTRP